jgi:hypothetical protein
MSSSDVATVQTCGDQAAPSPDAVAALLRQAGFPETYSLQPLAGGANNRAYRVEVEAASLFLKAYFRHPDDLRDRLGTEFAFTRFAWSHGVRVIAAPLAADPRTGLALYSFLEGRRLNRGEVDRPHVEQALQVVTQLNHHRAAPDARTLPRGSESCFTLAEHLECVERRIQRLASIEQGDDASVEAATFVQTALAPTWAAVRYDLARRAQLLGLSLDEPIPEEDRCLSPSDFGFHNALLGPDGVLRFYDFEYAGWDDPAKLACDFLTQVAVPVPVAAYEVVASHAASLTSRPELHRWRIDLLLPVYRLKWCCIVLNDFLPVAAARRQFAVSGARTVDRRPAQLERARALLVDVTGVRAHV